MTTGKKVINSGLAHVESYRHRCRYMGIRNMRYNGKCFLLPAHKLKHLHIKTSCAL